MLRPGNESRWIPLIFEAVREKKMRNAVTEKDVENASSIACGHYQNKRVVSFHWFQSLLMFAAFVTLNDDTDPYFSARRRLPSGFLVHRCASQLCFTDPVAVKQTNSDRLREFYNLHEWIRRRVKCAKMHVFPNESMLCVDDGGVESVSEMIRLELCNFPLQPGSAHLISIRPTCRSLISHSALVHRVIRYSVDELLTLQRSVFIVTDVADMQRVDESFLVGNNSVKMFVYSGMKHLFAKITAVIIHLTMNLS